MIDYGSVCSGIEAASVAVEPLGWKASWFAEIEAFPSAVLAHRFPDVANLGDMTKIAREILQGRVHAPSLLVGGTPCQAFSVAGMRAGLEDARGQLTIKFVELADAIDHVRAARGDDECIVWWENVPGVLSDKGNAFGCFLGALVGESDALLPAGGKWTDAGCVYGPRRTVAWRVLDAQYFGLAQRRRRVFVVASARAGFDPAAVLFEREGVRRDTAPRRGEGQDVAGTISSRTTGGGGLGTDFECAGGLQAVSAYGGGRTSGPVDVAACLVAKGQKCDFEVETFCVHGTQDPCVSDKAFALGRNSGQENAVFAIQAGALRTNPLSGPDGVGVQADHAYTLEARAEVQAVAYDFLGTPATEVAKETDVHTPLRARKPGQFENSTVTTVVQHSAVRRLTPRETERLQGFPDDHTMIPWRGKPAEECPDGPRYKAIGNSKAVPVVRWIAERITHEWRRIE